MQAIQYDPTLAIATSINTFTYSIALTFVVVVGVRVARAAVLAAETVVDGAVDLRRGVRDTAAVDRDTALAGLKRGSKRHGGNESEKSERELHFGGQARGRDQAKEEPEEWREE